MRKFALLLLITTSCAMPKNIKLTPTVANNLTFLYDRMPTEFAFCAYGTWDRNQVNIERIDIPYIYGANEEAVYYHICSGPNFLGTGHSHPKGDVCAFSETDIKTLLKTPAPFGFLICDDNKLVWYSKIEVKKELAKR